MLILRLTILLFLFAVPVALAQSPADEIGELVRQENFAKAIERGREILAENPEDGSVWYPMGIALLQTGANEESAQAFRAAAENGFAVEFSWYNAACAYSLANQIDEGLDCLKRSMAAGFDGGDIETDSDLDNLRKDPRFATLYQAPVYTQHEWAEPISFVATDGEPVTGVAYRARSKQGDAIELYDNRASLIILCHQSGSNHAEYVPIAPRLAQWGYQCLALDLRGGARKYGRDNETEAAWQAKDNDRGGGAQAKLDIEGVIAQVRARGFGGKIVLWGSSYTAGRLFSVIADRPAEVAAAIAMSPGRGYVQRGSNGEPSWAEQVHVPVFMTWPESEFTEERAATFEQLASQDKVLHRQQGGRHGSSTLHSEHNPNCEDVWKGIESFLATHVTP